MKHCFEADGIILRYGNRTILSDIYIKSETGVVTGLVGNNGSGKSSLLKLMTGAIEPECKSLRVDGVFIKKPLLKKGTVSYLPQHNFLPKQYTVSQVFKHYRLSLDEFAAKFDVKVQPKQKIVDLHHSMQRLMEIYTVLASDTKFAFLDEPFTRLSPLLGEYPKELINDMRKAKGIVITDHSFNTIKEVADDLYVLNNSHLRYFNSIDPNTEYRDLLFP